MSFTFTPESALTLSLSGTTGTFKAGNAAESVEVKYLLTHVSLDPGSSQDKALLKELAPFREIFNFKDLEFDELMQRDIDDARVSHELIPYILDGENHASVKFFPPIVVLLLPTEEKQVKPAAYYDEINIKDEPQVKVGGIEKWHVICSGKAGNETFQFEQPILQDENPEVHNFVKLRINPNKSKLVIVDGQHRAMALLALYRNTQKGWDNETKEAYKQYYAEWTPDIINSFDLKDIKLPIILCTLPALDKSYSGDFDLKKAARSIFLTLNQNARPVSNVRNLLLDDNDIVSSFLRKLLSEVKDRDITEENSFRIFNVELDQVENKVKLQSATALTGVQHLHYIIEHLLLNSDDVSGVSPRSGRFKSRKSDGYINGLKSRLKTSDVLGSDINATISRSHFSNAAELTLNDQFDNIYGKRIRNIFESLFPYTVHCDAVLSLKALVDDKSDKTIQSVFFDGQGVAKVFKKHLDNLNDKFKESSTPELSELLAQMNGKDKAISELEEKFKKTRFEKFCANLSDKSKLKDSEGNLSKHLIEMFNTLFENTLTTVAFQSAVVCGFFHVVEQVSDQFDGDESIDIDKELSKYLSDLNSLFKPTSFKKLQKLISVFSGALSGEDASNLNFIERSSDSFRSVVCRSEMQPDLWPKYRYVLLEIWKPENNELQSTVNTELNECREQVFEELYQDNLNKFKKQNLKTDSDLSKENLNEIFSKSFDSYKGFIKHLTGTTSTLNASSFKSLVL